MVFFGTNSTTLKDGQINNVTCPNCKEQTSFKYRIFQKYFHLYWIPAFPTGKENITECNNCHKTYYVWQLPEAFKKKFEFEKQGVGTKIWHWSGVMIIACIVAAVFYFGMKNDQENDIFITEPMRGDIYSYVTEDGYGHYSTLKIADVSADTLYVFLNDYETDQKSGISEIDVFRNYTLDTYVIPRAEIDAMYQSGKIFEIEREE